MVIDLRRVARYGWWRAPLGTTSLTTREKLRLPSREVAAEARVVSGPRWDRIDHKTESVASAPNTAPNSTYIQPIPLTRCHPGGGTKNSRTTGRCASPRRS